MKGFTLVEMLVALLVFSLVAVAGAGALSMAVDSREIVGRRMDGVGSLERARAMLGSDLEQVLDRRTRDAMGRARPVAFIGGQGEVLLAFVRAGWDNPDRNARASAQYLEYRLSEGRLERVARPMLDGAALGRPVVVLSGVRRARAGFLADGQWRADWVSSPAQPFPEAVRLELDLEGVGEVTQLFYVPPGAS